MKKIVFTGYYYEMSQESVTNITTLTNETSAMKHHKAYLV